MDPSGANAAMIAKLDLPFPLLSDPDGSGAIKPFGVWHDGPSLARPALLLVTPEGEAWRWVSRDFADRVDEAEAVAAAERLALPATNQEHPAVGTPAPSERAFPVEHLPWYYRGARFAAKAMALRVPAAKAEAEALDVQLERYTAVVRALLARS